MIRSEKMTGMGGGGAGQPIGVLEGSTELSRWSVFIRETFQNSNDQRVSPHEKIEFNIEVSKLPEGAALFVEKAAKVRGPHSSDRGLKFGPGMKFENMLVVSDSSTHGLSGTRNAEDEAGATSNFCKFFFYTGQLRQTRGKGGTYGIGRNVLFTASRNRTVFAYSAFIEEGARRTLFMGFSATDSFVHEGKNYQGDIGGARRMQVSLLKNAHSLFWMN
jgi:hypothetical protein